MVSILEAIVLSLLGVVTASSQTNRGYNGLDDGGPDELAGSASLEAKLQASLPAPTPTPYDRLDFGDLLRVNARLGAWDPRVPRAEFWRRVEQYNQEELDKDTPTL